MCELLEDSLSDTDEEVLHQNIFNAFLNIVTSFQMGAMLEMHLTDVELERVGLCHFALDCLVTTGICPEHKTATQSAIADAHTHISCAPRYTRFGTATTGRAATTVARLLQSPHAPLLCPREAIDSIDDQ